MNPFTLLIRLPLMPLTKVIQLGQVLGEHAEQELRNPASVRRQIEQAEQAHASGEISDEDLARVQAQAIDRLMPSPANPASPATGVSLGSARPKTAE